MNTRIKTIVLVLIAIISGQTYSQTAPFEINLEPVSITNLGGLQSFAFGQSDGKWLIVGGRLDGLHRRQPWAAFDVAGHNNQLIVVDPVAQQKWSAPLTSLPIAIQEQLSSTNMEFYQEGDYLYCLGGYGFSPTENDHITYPNLTAIKVSNVIDAIINNTSFASHIRQITHTQFQITGGRLNKIDDTYYLMGGQKFIGRYNPVGPGHGPGFVQEYSDSIRKFELIDNGTTITINHLPSYTDSENLHRRDYNAESQILPNGNEGITMFSGVFQPVIDLPFLNSVTIDANGYSVDNSFQQFYNHYHCPVLPLYSEENNEMHTVFFGGIAQFYDNNGTLVQDDNVPFVKTIARITRDSNGTMTEYKLPIEMPELLGAGGEFIPNLDFPQFNNGVYKMDNLTTDDTLIGYIYGGISSSAPNIFFINDGTQSSANNQIFKVFIKKSVTLSTDDLNNSSNNKLNLNIYPNPNEGEINLSFYLIENEDVKVSILDAKGSLIIRLDLTDLNTGDNHSIIEVDNLLNGGIYFITVETSKAKEIRKLIVEK